jgi:pantoate--beta-alanine ligase
LIVAHSIEELRHWRASCSGSVGAVYTMGALHDGHASLLQAARRENDQVVATLFVNPTQFSASEDLSRYPRRLDDDLAIFERERADLVFVPPVEAMYPPRFQTTVSLAQVTQGLEGSRRPGHFSGVATVVAKLFNLTQPHRCYFGQKDAQQVVVIRQMVRDLNFPLDVIVCPTRREADGLAMSSRNIYLSPDERKAASAIYRALGAVAALYDDGERRRDRLIEHAMRTLSEEPLIQPDYVSLNDAQTLEPAGEVVPPVVLLSITAALGRTHLLDNALLPLALNNQTDLTQWLGA